MTFQSSVAVEYILHVRILCHVVIFMNADGNKNIFSSTIVTFFILLKPLYNLQKFWVVKRLHNNTIFSQHDILGYRIVGLLHLSYASKIAIEICKIDYMALITNIF